MFLALGIVAIWVGGALLWVASHSLPAGARGVSGIWQQVLAGVGGRP